MRMDDKGFVSERMLKYEYNCGKREISFDEYRDKVLKDGWAILTDFGIFVYLMEALRGTGEVPEEVASKIAMKLVEMGVERIDERRLAEVEKVPEEPMNIIYCSKEMK